ncbi:MAG: 2-oxo acid dehydrogenase subunit E2 [Planctomycetota bacterium]|nr:MAG: 2-oxo acid dehydrogenase subunit E2 [Planctomycetota bacterium]
MTTLEFKLPDIGEGVHEGEIVRWIVPEGDAVKEDDPVVEVMTDKATVEIPSPASGVVTKHLVGEGEVAEVGNVIFLIDTASGGGASAPSAAKPQAAPPPPAAPAVNASASATAVAAPPAPAPPAVATDPGAKVLAAPATRRLAREMGVDLGAVRGTGPNGRILPADVHAASQAVASPVPAAPTAASAPVAPAAAAPAPMPLPSFPAVAGAREELRVPFRGVRKITADAMVRSKFTATHFSLIEEVDVTDLKVMRGQAKEVGSRYGVNITYMPYIMKATAAALQEFPQLNSMLDEDSQEVVTFQYVNLGVAADTPRGLMVPVVQDVHLKGLLQLATEVQDLAGRARDGKIKPDELKGSTFTITNAGNIGGVFATPIINFPNVAIMGVHAMRRLPRVMPDDSIVPRDILWISISIDHRLVDGADGARFMVRVRELLENPHLMLL